MQRTVVFILGTSFSGSSLLNSLLDSQPDTLGLGEAVHLIQKPTNAWCAKCQCHVDQCQLQAKIDPANFYTSVFDAYPQAKVIINSSKHWGQCFRLMAVPPPQFRLCVILLSKSLEEFGYSYSAHQSCDFEASFDKWFTFHSHLFRNLDGVLRPASQTHLQRQLSSRITEENTADVTYHELATKTDATIQRLCRQLDLPFDRGFRKQLWRGDTCTIGGNNAIYAQRSGNANFFLPQCSYLEGKYSGRQGSVFYDDQWMSDRELLRIAQSFRASKGDAIEVMDQRLGHPNHKSEVPSIP